MKKQKIRLGVHGSSVSQIQQGFIRVKALGMMVLGMMALAVPALANDGTILRFKPDTYSHDFSTLDYGESVRSNTRLGTTSLETSGGNGQDFFIYVKPNPGLHYDVPLEKFHSWSVSEISPSFPKGFHVEISPLEANQRQSEFLGDVTETVPGRMLLLAKNNDSFELAWTAGTNKLAKGSVLGWRVTLLEGMPHSAKIDKFLPYIRGRNHEFIYYGGAAMCNSRYGTTRLETEGGNGQNFFIYVADNPNADREPELSRFDTWTIKGLETYFPQGFKVDITPIPINGRSSQTLGKLTREAPANMVIKSEDSDSFVLTWKSESYPFPKSSLFGWEVKVTK